MTDLEQDFQAMLAALRDEKNRQISEYQEQARAMAQLAFETEQKSKTAYNVLYGQSRTARRWSAYSTSEEKRKMADVVLKTLNILNGKPAHEPTTEI